jgi:hypothetical protein
LGLPAIGVPVSQGMLEADDVGIAVVSKPHQTTLIAVDLVEPGTCAPRESTERDGRVVSFAQTPKDPASGAQLNEVVFIDWAGDLPSVTKVAKRAAPGTRLTFGGGMIAA